MEDTEKQKVVRPAVNYIFKEMEKGSALTINNEEGFAFFVKKAEGFGDIWKAIHTNSETLGVLMASYFDYLQKQSNNPNSKFIKLISKMPFERAYEFMYKATFVGKGTQCPSNCGKTCGECLPSVVSTAIEDSLKFPVIALEIIKEESVSHN